MKAFARHGSLNGILCLPGAIMFVAVFMFLLTGCGSSGGGGGGAKYEKLYNHQIGTESPSIVDVTLSATDQNNKPVLDLKLGDFILKEDGATVNPSTSGLMMYQRSSLLSGVTYSLVTVLLIDNGPTQANIIPNSSPQISYLDAEKEAAKNLVDFLNSDANNPQQTLKQQKIAIVTFKADGTPYVAQSMTGNPSTLKLAINGITKISTPGTGLDLYGGFLLGLDLWDNDMSVTNKVLQQGFLVALTGGIDTAGKNTIAAITAKQKVHKDDAQDKRIITVIVGPDDTVPAGLKSINNVPACKDNGYYVVADPTTKNKNNVSVLMSTLASSDANADSIQQIMLAYADSFYWLRYRTDKLRGTTPTLVVSILNNANPDTDASYHATVSGTFSTALFYTGMYANLTSQYVGSGYPWYVNAVFNIKGIHGKSLQGISRDEITAQEDNSVLDPASTELALYNRHNLPAGYTFALNTVLALDNSPSQAVNLGAIKAAAKAFIAGMDPDQKIALLAYNADPLDTVPDGTPEIVQPLTNDKTVLDKAVDAVKSTAGATEFYGSLLVGMNAVSDDASPADANFVQASIVAVTDGKETFDLARKQQVIDKLTAVNPQEIQNPQVIILGIGPEAAANTGLADIARTRIVIPDANNGLLLVKAPFAYDHGIYTNMIQKALVATQAAIKDDTEGFYWLRYKTTLNSTNAGNHTLTVGFSPQAKNDNTGADKLFTQNFTTAALYNGSPGVYLTPASGEIKNNVLNVPIRPGDSNVTFTLSAKTLLANSTPYDTSYTWSVSSGTSVTLLSSSGNEATFDVKSLGDSIITVTDTKNGNVATTLTISVTVDTADYYRLIPYSVEPESPWYVNTMFQVGNNADGWQTKLTRDYFSVWEDVDGLGAPYNSTDDPVQNDAQDLNAWKHNTLPTGYAYAFKTVILIDNTPSQAGSLDLSKAAAKKLIDTALATSGKYRIVGSNGNIQQQIAVASFDTNGDFAEISGFSTNRAALDSAVDSIGTGSGVTYLYGAIINALKMWDDDYKVGADKSITQGVLIIMTDGYDSMPPGFATLNDVIAARDGDTATPDKQIIAVGINNDFLSPAAQTQLTQIDNFGATGFYSVPDPGKNAGNGMTELSAKLYEIQQGLSAYSDAFYFLRYRSKAVKDTQLHAVKVAIKNNSQDSVIDGFTDSRWRFSTADFFDGVIGGIYFNASVANPGGVVSGSVGTYALDHVFTYFTGGTFSTSDNYTLHAMTYRPATSGVQSYTWSTDTPGRVDVQVDSSDSSTADLVPKTDAGPGYAYITVTNTTPGSSSSIKFKVTVVESPMPQPLLYYPFNGNANDASGNDYNGVVHGATLTADRHGTPDSAYSFNGTSDYIDIGGLHYGTDAGAYSDHVDKITVCAWVKSTSNTVLPIVGFDVTKYWRLTLNYLDLYNLGFHASAIDKIQAAGVVSPESYNDGQWHYVCATFDSSSNYSLKLYVDGLLVSSNNKFNGESIGTGVTQYGSVGRTLAGTNLYFQGAIDDIEIFGDALDSNMVKNLYDTTK